MKKFGIGVLIVLGVLLFIAALASLAFGTKWAGLKWRGYFAPKYAAVDREVFKQTRSFNEAAEQELLKLRLEYLREKDPISKEAIAFTIRHKFADYNEKLLDSAELCSFLEQIKYAIK